MIPFVVVAGVVILVGDYHVDTVLPVQKVQGAAVAVRVLHRLHLSNNSLGRRCHIKGLPQSPSYSRLVFGRLTLHWETLFETTGEEPLLHQGACFEWSSTVNARLFEGTRAR